MKMLPSGKMLRTLILLWILRSIYLLFKALYIVNSMIQFTCSFLQSLFFHPTCSGFSCYVTAVLRYPTISPTPPNHTSTLPTLASSLVKLFIPFCHFINRLSPSINHYMSRGTAENEEVVLWICTKHAPTTSGHPFPVALLMTEPCSPAPYV